MKFLVLYLSWVLSQLQPQPTKILFSAEQMLCGARTVYYEARGEPIAGKLAVMSVVLNRVRLSTSPNNICGVTNIPSQFPNPIFISEGNFDDWYDSVRVAVDAAMGLTTDITEGATCFYAHKKVPEPYWAKGRAKVTIANHTFVRDCI